MGFLKYLLLPVQIIYSLIILSRNKVYDYKIAKTYKPIPITISIGNLKNGGTGKTPMVEYLIKLFNEKKIAVLSRGYKRTTKGFVLANNNHQAKDIGDENYQLYNKYKNIIIACDNDRVNGIKEIEKKNSELDFVLLDDAYQHRALERDIDILLTEHNNLFSDDQLMPIGKLREHKQEMKRAHIIIITKSPINISKKEQNKIIKKIEPESNQKIHFSYIKEYRYINMNSLEKISLEKNESHALITGISNSKPLLNFFKNTNINYHHFKFRDHYNFKDTDISRIIELKKSKNLSSNLLITEKDYYRLSLNHKKKLQIQFQLICVQIEIDFIEPDKSDFNNQLLNFEKSKIT